MNSKKRNILFGYRMREELIRLVINKLKNRYKIEGAWSKRDSRRGLMLCVRDGTADGVVTDMVIARGTAYGDFTAEELAFYRMYRDVRVIPLLSTVYRGTPFMRVLLENGVYDAIFAEDVGDLDDLAGKIADRIAESRRYRDAKAYYDI